MPSLLLIDVLRINMTNAPPGDLRDPRVQAVHHVQARSITDAANVKKGPMTEQHGRDHTNYCVTPVVQAVTSAPNVVTDLVE